MRLYTDNESSLLKKIWQIGHHVLRLIENTLNSEKYENGGPTAIPVFQRSLPAGQPLSLSVPTPASIRENQRESWVVLLRLEVCVGYINYKCEINYEKNLLYI